MARQNDGEEEDILKIKKSRAEMKVARRISGEPKSG